jgi:hypothetical protein
VLDAFNHAPFPAYFDRVTHSGLEKKRPHRCAARLDSGEAQLLDQRLVAFNVLAS